MAHKENGGYCSSEETISTRLDDFTPPSSEASSLEESALPQVAKDISGSTPSTESFHGSQDGKSSGSSSIPEWTDPDGATGGSLNASSAIETARILNAFDLKFNKLLLLQKYFEEPDLEHSAMPHSGRPGTPQLQCVQDMLNCYGDANNNNNETDSCPDLQALAESFSSISIPISLQIKEPLINQAGAIVGHSTSDATHSFQSSIESVSTIPIEEAFVGSGHFSPLKNNNVDTTPLVSDSPERIPSDATQGAIPKIFRDYKQNKLKNRAQNASDYLKKLWKLRKASEGDDSSRPPSSSSSRVEDLGSTMATVETAVKGVSQSALRREEDEKSAIEFSGEISSASPPDPPKVPNSEKGDDYDDDEIISES